MTNTMLIALCKRRSATPTPQAQREHNVALHVPQPLLQSINIKSSVEKSHLHSTVTGVVWKLQCCKPEVALGFKRVGQRCLHAQCFGALHCADVVKRGCSKRGGVTTKPDCRATVGFCRQTFWSSNYLTQPFLMYMAPHRHSMGEIGHFPGEIAQKVRYTCAPWRGCAGIGLPALRTTPPTA